MAGVELQDGDDLLADGVPHVQGRVTQQLQNCQVHLKVGDEVWEGGGGGGGGGIDERSSSM